MTINDAHRNLAQVISQARISLNGQPLTLTELDSLAQSEMLIYSKAKELEEVQKEEANKPAEGKS